MIPTDIGHGRGWLDAAAAASIARIDQQLGRPADINDAGRSAEQADENYRKWLAFKNGTGPWAPYALPASQSVHCDGEAADSDDWYNPDAAAVWSDHGWRQTARYDDDRDEPWHGEYFIELDNHRHETAGTTKEDDMDIIHCNGKEYGISPGQISHLGSPDHSADAQNTTGKKVTRLPLDNFARTLDNYGIPRNVLNSDGHVLNPETRKYEKNGLWSWERSNKAILDKLLAEK